MAFHNGLAIILRVFRVRQTVTTSLLYLDEVFGSMEPDKYRNRDDLNQCVVFTVIYSRVGQIGNIFKQRLHHRLASIVDSSFLDFHDVDALKSL